MTADEQSFQNGNLAFFRSMFIEPGIVPFQFEFDQDSAAPLLSGFSTPTPIMHSMCLIESTLWLQLGIEIGFFNAESVLQELVSIEDRLSLAWRTLQENESLAPQTWCDFMLGGTKPKFMKDQFFGPQEKAVGTFDNLDDSRNLEHLRQCFLGCLLLTSEVMFDEATMGFLENVGWDTDEKWEALIRGYEMSWDFRLEDIDFGFANHVHYLKQLRRYIVECSRGSHDFNIPHFDIEKLGHRVSEIISRRVIVDRTQPKERLFKLCSQILAVAYQPGREWQQARISIFQELMVITESEWQLHARLWSDFVDNINKDLNRATREGPLGFSEGSSFATE
jgi:hypothetical protein